MFLGLHIPDFPVSAALRGIGERTNSPCGVLAPSSGKAETLPLLAVNRAARGTGIDAGWQLNRARIRCPDLRVVPSNPEAERRLLGELVELGDRISADLEITACDGIVLDLAGRMKPVTAILEDAWIEGAEIWWCSAPTPDLAHLACRYERFGGRTVLPSDLEALPLPFLESLTKDAPMVRLLEMWGIRNLGGFISLPRQALIERLGPEAGHWHDVLKGKHCRLLRLHRPPESMAQRLDFEEGAATLDPVVFGIKRLLHALASRMACRHLAAGRLDLRLLLDCGGAVERSIRLAEPQAAVEGMLAPLQTWLDELRIDSAVKALELDAVTTFATAAQREWFGKQLPQPGRWAETLAKLEALLGPGRVGIPVPSAFHDPEKFTLHSASENPSVLPARPDRPDCPVPLNRYRPPRPVAVAFETRNRRPWPLAVLNGPFPGEITGRRGPFPVSGDWWASDAAWQRLEWDIQLASGHLLRLTFETPDRWQLEGIYR